MLNEPLGTIKGRMRLGLEKIRSHLAEGFAEGVDLTTERPQRLAARTSPHTRSARSTPPRRARSRPTSPSCERCRAELRWLEPAVDLLAESVEQVEPSADRCAPS